MTTQQQFNEWVTATYPNVSPASAWQHQQARIDEVLLEYKKLSKLVTSQGIEIMDLLDQLNYAIEALTYISSLSGNPKGERRYDLIWEKANEALKLIEVRE